MKVLLRHTRSGLFYAGENHWVPKESLARDFEEVDRAQGGWTTRALAEWKLRLATITQA